MALAVRLAVRGNLKQALAADGKAIRAAETNVVRRATRKMHTALRQDIVRAGLSTSRSVNVEGRKRAVTKYGGLANAVRQKMFPARADGRGAVGVVYSKALVVRDGRLFDLITAFDEGVVIRPRTGRYLAIPIGVARVRGGRWDGPERLAVGSVEFRRAEGGSIVVVSAVDERVLWVLVRQVTIAKRLNVDRIYTTATATIVDQYNRELDKQLARAASRITALAA